MAAGPNCEAPGAKKSRVFGILSILAAITIIGIPFAIAFGIFSVLQSGKAKQAALSNPTMYLRPTSSGTVLGVVGMVVAVLMLFPALIATPLLIASYMSHQEQGNVERMLVDLKAKRAEQEKMLETLRLQQVEDLTKTIEELEIKLKHSKSASDTQTLQAKIAETKQELESAQKQSQ